MSAPSVVAPKSSSSFLEDIVDVFYAPSAVFERRRLAGYGLALLLYAILSGAMLYAARPVMRPMFDRQMDKAIEKMNANPNLNAEQKASMSTRMRGAFDSPFALAIPAIILPVSLFITGFTLWVCAKLFGSAATYAQSMMVTTFASFPRMLVTALMTGYSIATGREVVSQYGLTFSPALLLPDSASPLMGALASRLDVGVLWTTALLGIGIAIVGRMTRNNGFGAAALVWVLGGIFAVVTALREMAG